MQWELFPMQTLAEGGACLPAVVDSFGHNCRCRCAVPRVWQCVCVRVCVLCVCVCESVCESVCVCVLCVCVLCVCVMCFVCM